jgi:PII-like signaling protein
MRPARHRGFGTSSRIHTSRLVSLEDDLPVTVSTPSG